MKHFKGKAWAKHVAVFNTWGEGIYQAIVHELLKLREPTSEKKILHISLDGIRGVDYRLGAPAHVIAAYDVPNITMLRQGGGRGARLFTDTCKLTLIIPSCSMLAPIKASQIEQYLSDNELTLSAADSLKRAVLKAIDGEVPTKTAPAELLEMTQILVNPQRKLLPTIETDKEESVRNYKRLKQSFPGLPENCMTLLHGLI